MCLLAVDGFNDKIVFRKPIAGEKKKKNAVPH